MRAALISMLGQPGVEEGSNPLVLCGKSLAHRQLDFALAAGCERVIVLGDGRSTLALSLRHAAEDAGARFQTIGGSAGLLGTVSVTDQLLVLAPGLLPEARQPLDSLSSGAAVLVLPAGPGVGAGFERIDLERAWAGAALVPGSLVERLAALPDDIDPASALMRAALQARVPQCMVPETLVAEGRWTMLSTGTDVPAAERAWLLRHSPRLRAVPDALSGVILRGAGRALATPRFVRLLAIGTAALLVGAVTAASAGQATVGFAMIAVAALLAAGTSEAARLREAPFGAGPRRLVVTLAVLADLALLACAVLTIEGAWTQRLFPPLVMLAALHLRVDPALPPWARSRVLLAAFLGLAAGLELVEPAVMAAALALLALRRFRRHPQGA